MELCKKWAIGYINIRMKVERWTCHGLLARSKKVDQQFHSESYGKTVVSASPHEGLKFKSYIVGRYEVLNNYIGLYKANIMILALASRMIVL